MSTTLERLQTTERGANVGLFANDRLWGDRWSDCKRRDMARALERLRTSGCNESIGVFVDYGLSRER